MLEKLNLLKRKSEGVKRLPFHIAMTTHGIREWSKKHNKSFEETYKKVFQVIDEIIDEQIKNKIRIITLYLMPVNRENSECYPFLLNAIVEFFTKLAADARINNNQVKVSVLGKWYNVPKIIDPVKKIIDETKDYDNFFLNFCINYNGREEILDACRIVAMKVKNDKVDPNQVDKDMIKDNIYTSYFLPPDVIVKNGSGKSLGGFLLWDSVNSVVHFSETLFPDFSKSDFSAAVSAYEEQE